MKTMILSLILCLGFAMGASRVKLIDQTTKSQSVMNDDNDPVVIDSSESVTSDIYLDLTGLSFEHWTDTLGQVFMRCDDSAGTDSVAGRLIWEGNPDPSGGARGSLWEPIDSVSIAAASGTETQTSKAVVNSKRYLSLRFKLRNQLAPDAAKKSICRDITLNRQKRLIR